MSERSDPSIVDLEFLRRQLAKAGGGDHTGGMESRLAKVEATVEHIQTDVADIKIDIRDLRGTQLIMFFVTWGGIIASALGLAGLMAKGFGWL